MEPDQAWDMAVKNSGLAKMFLKTRMASLRVGVMNYDDYFQAAILGLYCAALKYDPKKSKFSVYAYSWMHQSISRTFRNEGFGAVRVPSFMYDQVSKINRKHAKDMEGYMRTIKSDTVRCAFAGLSDPIAINKKKDNFDEEPAYLLDDRSDYFDRIDSTEKMSAFLEALKTLDTRERFMLDHLYGLNGKPIKTIKTISRMLRVAHSTGRRIKFEAYQKIKNYMGEAK